MSHRRRVTPASLDFDTDGRPACLCFAPRGSPRSCCSLAAALGLHRRELARSARRSTTSCTTHRRHPRRLRALASSHWIQDGLLAVFFFVVAVELQFELTAGQLNSARKALQPAIAAAGGVLVPIAVYLAFAGGTDAAAGWPIPTATDIAFALGVLAVFGKGLPASLRIFLLALAILDDIVGIIFIAVLFTDGRRLRAARAAAAVTVVAVRRAEPAARHAARACSDRDRARRARDR